MRDLVGLICVLALGVVPLVGCSDAEGTAGSGGAGGAGGMAGSGGMAGDGGAGGSGAVCGNGTVEGDEDCDDMGESATCNADCTFAECGDGVHNATAGEDCDDMGESATCNVDCTSAECGDAVLNVTAGEDCDDGNTAAADGCGPTCLFDLANGSFESEDYTDWTLLEDSGGPTNGAWAIVQDGSTIPGDTTLFDFFDEVDVSTQCLNATGPVTVAATDGTFAAMQIQNDAENHRIYQDISLSPGTTTLSWDMAYQNSALFNATSQFIAINVRDPDTDAIIETLFKTTDGVDMETIPMSAFSVDISAYAGMNVRIDLEHQVQDNCFDAVYDFFRVF